MTGKEVIELNKKTVRRFLIKLAEEQRPLIARLDREKLEARAQAYTVAVTNETKP